MLLLTWLKQTLNTDVCYKKYYVAKLGRWKKGHMPGCKTVSFLSSTIGRQLIRIKLNNQEIVQKNCFKNVKVNINRNKSCCFWGV